MGFLIKDTLEKNGMLLLQKILNFINIDHLIGLGILLIPVLFTEIQLGILAILMLCFYVYFVYGDFIYRSYLTLNRDLGGLYLLLTIKYDLNKRMKANRPIPEIFLENVRKSPNKTAVIDISTCQTYTFHEFNVLANRFANYFQEKGYKSGDVVALFMENSVEFVAAWLGLAKIGVVTAWINSNLKMEPLVHCVLTSEAKAIICSEQLAPAIKSAREAGLFKGVAHDEYVYGDFSPYINIKTELQKSDVSTIEPIIPKGIDFKSVLCFIYTSGTTGMPKAAVMKHFRYYSMVMGSAKSFAIQPTDRVYISMPLYHTSAGIIGIGQMILTGCSCAIRKKFSASNFWKDCVKYECTVSQYIGEICRYLLAQPQIHEENEHKVRLLYGNGLRAEIWDEFVKRFRVKIGELYGSTEGTSNLINSDGKVGACGFLPISPLTSRIHPVRLIKLDEATGEVLRGKDGLCVPCRPGETGAMVSTIRKNNPLLIFEGYLNKNETSKKIIYDVFQRGDSVFLTGDILHWDRLGYIYFKDRTGDTFRWKGENVSTTEVEAVLMPLRSLVDVTVYGVKVPGTEGRAGMAAIVKSPNCQLTEEEFLDEIAEKLSATLAPYAIPVFIRLCEDVDKTGTYKLVKTNLQKLSYLPDSQGIHRVFIWDMPMKKYIHLTEERRKNLEDGGLLRF